MQDEDYVPGLPRNRRASAGPGTGSIIVVSILTSVFASVATVAVVARLAPGLLNATSATPGGAGTAAASPDEVRVPDLVRVPVENVGSVLASLRLALEVRSRRADALVPSGAVISQTPAAGSSARRGQTVEVIVSSGPPPSAAPVSPPVAPSAPLVAAPATPQPVGALPVAPIPAVPVAPAVAPVAPAVPVGDPGAMVEVPRLVGVRFQRVRSMLDPLGLRIGSHHERFDEDRGPFVVLRQSVAAGTRVARGTAIDLVVNQGE